MIERLRSGAANGAVWKGNIRSPLVARPSGNKRIFTPSFSFLLISDNEQPHLVLISPMISPRIFGLQPG